MAPDGQQVLRQEAGATTLYLDGTELTLTGSGTVPPAQGTPATLTGLRYYSHTGQTIAVRTATSNDTVATLIPDWQGTTHQQVANATGQLSTTWQDPYGNPRGTPPATWAGQRGFVGGTKDTTGLTRIGARDYDPVLGRFITVDPVQSVDDPLQWNPYLYANNSPVTASDPTGLMVAPDRGGSPAPKRGVGHITKPKTQTNKSPRQSGGRTAPVQHGPSAPNLPGNFFAGAGWGLWDNAAGLGQAALDTIMDPLGLQRGQRLAAAIAANGIDGTATQVWEGITKPYTSRWESGDQAGAIGYGAAELLITLIGTKGATKIGTTATKIETSIAEKAVPAVANEGIYVVRAEAGTYVGQSGTISTRLGQHVTNGKFTQAEVDAAERISVPGGKTAREIAEQLKLDELGGKRDPGILNKVNPVGDRRLDLMPAGYAR